jgi:hypothetical protein
MGINVLLFKVIDFLKIDEFNIFLSSTPLFDVFYYPIYSLLKNLIKTAPMIVYNKGS